MPLPPVRVPFGTARTATLLLTLVLAAYGPAPASYADRASAGDSAGTARTDAAGTGGPGTRPATAAAYVPTRPVSRADRPPEHGDPRAGTQIRFDGDTLVTRTDARAAAGRRIRLWPGHKIYYYESIPAKWQWSLDDAVAHWNGTGANLKLIQTTSRKRARLFIGYGQTFGADGVGTLGYAWPYRNYVHLSTKYKRVNENNAAQRAWVARLFAHEIGHNLGYDHVRGPQCALMYPVFAFGTCGPLTKDQPGYYQCRYIDRALLRRHVANYGGRAQQPAKDCLLAPLPPALDDLQLTGGDLATDSVVTVHWNDDGQPAGAKVTVTHWAAQTCNLPAPRSARTSAVAASAQRWVGPEKAEGHWCYAVQVANRFDGARDPVVLEVDRERPAPDAPTVSEITFDGRDYGGVYRFTASAPAGTELVVQSDAEDPARCRTTYDGSFLRPEPVGTDTYEIPAYAADQCLVFFAITPQDRSSVGVIRHASAPAPAAPTIIEVTRLEGGDRYEVVAEAGGNDMAGALIAGGCPDTFPDLYDATLLDFEPVEFYANEEGPHCLALISYNGFGFPGPMTTREIDVIYDN